MERDAFIALGVSSVIKQRLMDLSDKFKTTVCGDCGLLCIGNPVKKIYICKACNSNNVVWIQIPYASKQLILSLYALGIAPRILVDKDEKDPDKQIKIRV